MTVVIVVTVVTVVIVVTVVTVMTVVTKKLFSPENFFSFYKKTQNLTKLENSNCDNSKNKIFTKL